MKPLRPSESEYRHKCRVEVLCAKDDFNASHNARKTKSIECKTIYYDWVIREISKLVKNRIADIKMQLFTSSVTRDSRDF